MKEGIRAFDKSSEETVISAMLIGDDAVDMAEQILESGAKFRTKLFELVYDAILALRDTDTPIDATNIAGLVDGSLVGMSKQEIYEWALDYTSIGDIWSHESIRWHAERIRDLAEVRNVDQRLRRLMMENMTDEADLSSVYAQLEEILRNQIRYTNPEVMNVETAAEKYREFVASIQQNRISFGWPSVDRSTRGLVPGDVCLIFARTNVGKSALAQSMQLSIWTRQKIRSIFFSMEMPVTSVFERLVSMTTGWKEDAIEQFFREGDEERITDLSTYGDGMLFVDRAGLSLKDISRISETQDEIGVIFIDYMGLIRTKGLSLYERLSGVATELKEMAKELGIVIVCVCQVSRKAGDGTTPITIDMGRDSGQIEEAADVILGMHRDKDDDTIIRLTVLKARRGRKGATCQMGFHGDSPKLVEITE